jgi:hypothetical protein
MSRKRSISEQVKSGCKIAANLFLGFFFLAALLTATAFFSRTNNAETQGAHRILGGAALILLAVILFATSKYWAKWAAGVVLYLYLKSWGLVLLAVGHPFKVDLITALTTIAFFVVSLLVAITFLMRPPAGSERLGLVAMVVCAPFALILHSWVPWLVGVACAVSGQVVHTAFQRRTEIARS